MSKSDEDNKFIQFKERMFTKGFFAFLYYMGLISLAAWLNRKQVMILCYHCVTPRPDLISSDFWKMFLDAGLFEKHLDFLQKNYHIVSLGEYLEARRANRPLPPSSVVLTFDDGKRNFLTIIAPQLIKRNLPATTFLVVNNTEKAFFVNGSANPQEWNPDHDREDLSWEDISRLLKNKNIDVGSHSMTHPHLCQIPLDEAEKELKSSYQILLSKTGCKNPAIAYPHGLATEEIMKIAESVGYTCGLTNTDAGNDFETNLFNLNRTVINSDDALPAFAARVAGLTWRLNKIKNKLRSLIGKTGTASEGKFKLSADFIIKVFL